MENNSDPTGTPSKRKKVIIGSISIALLGTGLYFGYRGIHHLGIHRPPISKAKPVRAAEFLTFKVSGMSCEGCASSATKALLKVSGVQTAEVDYESGQAKVGVEKGFSDKSKLAQVLKEAGFTLSQ